MKIKGILPVLETNDLKQTIEFYQKFLDFECRGAYPDQENPYWASLWNGQFELSFGLPNAHTDFQAPKLTGSIYLHVENVDEIWQELKDKVEIVYKLENMDYGMREFGIKDCNGYILNIGQSIT